MRSLLYLKTSLQHEKSSNVSGFFIILNCTMIGSGRDNSFTCIIEKNCVFLFSLCSCVALEISQYMKNKHLPLVSFSFLFWRPAFLQIALYLWCVTSAQYNKIFLNDCTQIRFTFFFFFFEIFASIKECLHDNIPMFQSSIIKKLNQFFTICVMNTLRSICSWSNQHHIRSQV